MPDPDTEPSVRVTLSEMYKLLQRVAADLAALSTSTSQVTSTLGEHQGRLNAHSESIHTQGERIGRLEAGQIELRNDIVEIRADKAPRTGAVPVIALVTAASGVVVAMLAAIVSTVIAVIKP